METDELKETLSILRRNGISLDRVKSVSIQWEKILKDKAFPHIVVELYELKGKNENI